MAEVVPSAVGGKTPCVTVVVPVFNSEEYLRQCLDSIVAQTLADIEIICIDDGSTDASLEILRQYAALDSRIRILEQPNLRAGVARNNGMKQARGEYLAFWDSDDYFDTTALEKMYAQCKADDADICVCGASRIMDGVNTPVKEGFYLQKSKIPETVPFNIDTNRDFILTFTNAAPWNKLYRRSFVEQNGIEYSTAANSEDVYFVEVALCLAGRITVVDEPLIVYRRDRPGSLTNTIADSRLTSLEVWIDTARRLRELGVYPEVSFANRAASNIAYMLRNQKGYESFGLIVNALKKGGLEELSLFDVQILTEEWHRSLYSRIRSDTPEEVLMYLMNFTYIKLTEASMRGQVRKEKINVLKKRLKKAKERERVALDCERKMRASWSYRLGKAFTWLPRKCRQLFKPAKSR